MKKLLVFFLSFAMVVPNVFTTALAKDSTEEAPYYYVALGDSIGAGYNLPGSSMYTTTNPRLNYKNDPSNCYPYLIAEELASIAGYEGDVHDYYSNLCLAAALTQDTYDILTDPDFYVVNESYFGHSPESLKVHDIMVEEIAKATVMSVNIGNNDLITDAIIELGYQGSGVYYPGKKLKSTMYTSSEGFTVKVFDPVKNPIILAVWYIVMNMAQGIVIEPDYAVSVMKAYIEYYTSDATESPLTFQHITEAIEFMSSDNLSEMMVTLAKACEEVYPSVIDEIRSINPDAQLNIISYYAAFGNSLTVDGVTYDFQTVVSTIAKSAATQLLKYNAFTGATVEEYMNAVMADCMEELTYPLVYLIMGQCTQAGVEELNGWLQEYCEEESLNYVDIFNIENENDTDPHPNEEGHVYIANQALEQMICDVEVNVEGSSKTTVTGNTTVIANTQAIYTVSCEPGYKINSVTLNGQVVDVKDNTFTAKITKDSTILVDMVSTFPFIDVPEGKWYYPYVKAVYELGLMTGTSENTFRPSASITRGQLATILYRMEGEPEVDETNSFSDVAEGKFYSESINWAKTTGIVHGYTDGTFKPANNITRQELAIMLRNYAAYCGEDVHADVSVLDIYPDASSVSGYAKESVAWAVANGLISGTNGMLDPKGNATRGQAAKMILATNDLLA